MLVSGGETRKTNKLFNVDLVKGFFPLCLRKTIRLYLPTKHYVSCICYGFCTSLIVIVLLSQCSSIAPVREVCTTVRLAKTYDTHVVLRHFTCHISHIFSHTGLFISAACGFRFHTRFLALCVYFHALIFHMYGMRFHFSEDF